jgi:hypothetical protein
MIYLWWVTLAILGYINIMLAFVYLVASVIFAALWGWVHQDEYDDDSTIQIH